MTKSADKSWRARLLTPSPSLSVLSLLGIGIAIGVLGLLGFDTAMRATSTDSFCTSCHAMDSPYAQLQKTSHFANTSGVRATCADCHVPHEFVPKMIRKIEAAREVWGTITGVIDTPEKYAAHAPAMKAREIARLRRNDSQECRNCHEVEHMLTAVQSSKAQKYHQAMTTQGKTCIDCHAGIAHPDNTESLPQAAN